MIHSFKIKNFYSIGDAININLESRKKVVSSPELYVDAPLDKKVTKIEFIGGKNASGKTNVLRALAFIKYLIVDSAGEADKHSEIPYQQFFYLKENPTELSVRFSFDNKYIYQYSVILNKTRIIEEELIKSYFVDKKSATSTIFTRKWLSKKIGYETKISDEMPILNKMTSLESLNNDNFKASFISVFSNFDEKTGILSKIKSYWENVISNVMSIGSTESELSLTKLSARTLQEIYEQKDLKEYISEMLRKFDIGFSKIDKKEKMGANQDEVIYGILHEYNGSSFGSSMHAESNGTKRLIILVRDVWSALATGGVAVIDELDAFLHPDIYDDIIEKFMSININKKNSQLIFSSHNYTTLTKLDKQQITLTDKNNQGETEAWRLDEMSGVRPDDNFYQKYLMGAYGAKPNIG